MISEMELKFLNKPLFDVGQPTLQNLIPLQMGLCAVWQSPKGKRAVSY